MVMQLFGQLHKLCKEKEKDQKFVPYVWITMWWDNDYIGWDLDRFCDMKFLSIPAEIMWKPDLTIEEMTEVDKAPPSPYLAITNEGKVEVTNDQVLVSTCRMQIYRFPFDIQSCSLSFKSVIHSVEEIQIFPYFNSNEATKESKQLMRTQSEWLFMDLEVTNKTVNNFGFNQSVVVYTITMKRRPVLYVANFLLPIFFFLCLDMASFLLSDTGGEKLGYKITVLLAVTLMQILLNDILPSTSNRIPLIVIYCMGMFSLMLLSVLETILVMYLIEKDSESQDNETDREQTLNEDNLHRCKGDTVADLPPVAKEGSRSKRTEESQASEKHSEELQEVMKTLIVLLSSRMGERKPSYWTKMTKRINKVFFISYVIAASLFILFMTLSWCWLEDN
ncbi:5-hydroxytryptamine receptor 3A-like [Mugil cephalus]|uniref:5-hydroxytryptamine receptor 3A-like n=1 Tax=Mugil cephalus TaxID=48193 RepID=UPI001FB83993|nr:5-hydroxytryptamine receptor 3A-like [Mugil cephalus]